MHNCKNDTFINQKNKLIRDIYMASNDIRLWSGVLKEIAQLTNSKSSILMCQNRELKYTSILSSFGISSESLKSYNTQYDYINRSLDPFSTAPLCCVTTYSFTPENEPLYDCPTYTNFYKPQGIAHLASLPIARCDKGTLTLLTLHRCVTSPKYEDNCFLALNEFVLHLQAAINLKKIYSNRIMQCSTYKTTFDLLQIGLIFINKQAKITNYNKAAELLINQHPSINIRDNKIHTTSCMVNTLLDKKIHQAIISNETNTPFNPKPLLLRGIENFSTLTLLVKPLKLQTSNLSSFKREGSSIIFLSCEGKQRVTSSYWLKHLYSLTSAEADVAIHLSNAMSAVEISQLKGVKITTVRTQIYSVFAKMEVANQAQLVKTFLDSPYASIIDSAYA